MMQILRIVGDGNWCTDAPAKGGADIEDDRLSSSPLLAFYVFP